MPMKAFLLITTKDDDITNFLQFNFPTTKKFVINFKPSKNEYSIEDIKLIKKNVFYHYSQLVIYILKNFDKSSLEAQNAFLKLLEEPPEKVYFILTAKNQHHLLPTIISRVKLLVFSTHSQKINNFNEKLLKPHWPSFSSKEEAIEFLNKLITFLQEKIEKKYPTFLLKELIKIYNLVINNNLNYQLAIDHLLILLKKNSILFLENEKKNEKNS